MISEPRGFFVTDDNSADDKERTRDDDDALNIFTRVTCVASSFFTVPGRRTVAAVTSNFRLVAFENHVENLRREWK